MWCTWAIPWRRVVREELENNRLLRRGHRPLIGLMPGSRDTEVWPAYFQFSSRRWN